MVPREKGYGTKIKREMPALEATREMQLMLCLPFSFQIKHGRYNFFNYFFFRVTIYKYKYFSAKYHLLLAVEFRIKSILVIPTINIPISTAVSTNRTITTLFTNPYINSIENISTDNAMKHI